MFSNLLSSHKIGNELDLVSRNSRLQEKKAFLLIFSILSSGCSYYECISLKRLYHLLIKESEELEKDVYLNGNAAVSKLNYRDIRKLAHKIHPREGKF
jgi:hypothetical protein